MTAPLQVRPYQVLCLICREGEPLPGDRAVAAAELARLIAQYPDRPVALVANAHDVYAYQDPGDCADRDGGPEFNRKRDLDILALLDLAPGSVLPARTLLHRVRKAIPTVQGVCGCEQPAAEGWRGCPRAASGSYERGHALGLACLVAPRDAGAMAADKAASVAELERGELLRIRPHVIMCAVCNYGKNEGVARPLAEDNIVEFIEAIRRNPEVPVALAPGADWMICASCPQRVGDLNACVNVAGSGGLSNEKRDLDLLQVLGLTYEAVLPARELLRLLFTRVPDTSAICRRDQGELSVWWDGCGVANRAAGNAGYTRGRQLLSEELGLRLGAEGGVPPAGAG